MEPKQKTQEIKNSFSGKNAVQAAQILTSIDRYGVKIKANPAATLHAPTPIFRIAVGYNSAVYTGMIVFPALIVNLPAIIQLHCISKITFFL